MNNTALNCTPAPTLHYKTPFNSDNKNGPFLWIPRTLIPGGLIQPPLTNVYFAIPANSSIRGVELRRLIFISLQIRARELNPPNSSPEDRVLEEISPGPERGPSRLQTQSLSRESSEEKAHARRGSRRISRTECAAGAGRVDYREIRKNGAGALSSGPRASFLRRA